MTRRRTYLVLAAACALPRLAVLLYERGSILGSMEKSDLIARVFLKSGTFGYVPGEPSAYTQPMYGWFLIAVYWILGRHWWSVGGVQIVVACCTAIVVYEIGRRFLSRNIGLLGALIATLQPYLIWHDVHGNREILDQLLGAAMFGLALYAAENRSPWIVVALGAVSGLAILSNTRLVALPIVFTIFLMWRGHKLAPALLVPVLAGLVMSPWVIRNKVEVGCWAITTDARALWKANDIWTYPILAHGGWIDNVADQHDIAPRQVHPIPFKWYTAEEAGDYYAAHGVKIKIDECMQMTHYEHLVEQFWEHHPGAKAKLMVQATRMLWTPVVAADNSSASGVGKAIVEPIFVVPLYLLALIGLFVVPPAFRVLALAFAGYETLAAWVFAGTTRYRVPWDFVLALLAAAAISAIGRSIARRRSPPIQ